ncbi:hypothetical protein EDD86DRAFT_117560 [Gorgonomyces haynaldii]|nr:hypothetical protein EDD86DRAFT_117560 [Gorgonomyces haynaldii]
MKYGEGAPSAPACPLKWIRAVGGQEVPTAVLGGSNKDGGNLYVARAYIDGDEILGKTTGQFQGCWIPFNGREVIQDAFEILTGDQNLLVWQSIPNRSNFMDFGPVLGGIASGEEYFVARAMHNGKWIPGGITVRSPCKFTYNGEELLSSEFQVLCFKKFNEQTSA